MAFRCTPESMKDFIASSVVQTVRVQNAMWASRNNDTLRLPSETLAWRDERTANNRKGTR